jgi:type IV fimbrial biogenesis protein FimT
MQTIRRRAQAGITLIETCVTMSIACVLLGTALPSFDGTITRRQLEGTASELMNDIGYVRSEAVSRNRPVRISFHDVAAGSCTIIHTGAAADCSCSDAGVAQCSGDAVALKSVFRPTGAVAVQTNVASMLFDPVRGTTSPAGTVRVVSDAGSIHHVVNIMGRARSCSPDGAVKGYKAC